MRPQKIRQPNSIEDALLEIYTTLGLDKAADVVEKSESHLRKWSDPDQDALPTFKQVAQLDAACLRKNGRAPLLEVYTRWMAAVAKDEGQDEAGLVEAFMAVTSGIGQVAEELQHAVAETSESGSEISPNEATRIRKLLNALIRSSERMDGALRKKQRLSSASIFDLRPKL